MKAGASYSEGISDFGVDGPFSRDFVIGTNFGVGAFGTGPGSAAAAINSLEMDLVEGYSFYGQVGADISIFAVNLIGTYGHIEYPVFQGGTQTRTGGDEAEAYTVALNASVSPVEGLRMTGEVFYSDVEVDANVLNLFSGAANNAFRNQASAVGDRDFDDDQFGAIFASSASSKNRQTRNERASGETSAPFFVSGWLDRPGWQRRRDSAPTATPSAPPLCGSVIEGPVRAGLLSSRSAQAPLRPDGRPVER